MILIPSPTLMYVWVHSWSSLTLTCWSVMTYGGYALTLVVVVMLDTTLILTAMSVNATPLTDCLQDLALSHTVIFVVFSSMGCAVFTWNSCSFVCLPTVM